MKIEEIIVKKRKILIVSPYFAPENSVASIRFTKLAKYLTRRGHSVTVLCADMTENYLKDELLERDLKEIGRVIRIRLPFLYYVPLRYPSQKSLNEEVKTSRKKDILYKVAGKCFSYVRTEKTSLWWATIIDRISVFQYIKILHKMKVPYFDWVITTYHPMSAHFVGYYMKKKKWCKTWMADYRDVISAFVPYEKLPFVTRRWNKKVQIAADVITVVSKGQKKQLFKESYAFKNKIHSKVHVLSNGYDPEDYAKGERKADKNMLSFCYFGSLYGIENEYNNDPYLFFKALSELSEENVIKKEKIRFVYGGKSWKRLKEIAERYGMGECVINLGFLTRKKVIEIQLECDIFLLFIWNGEERQGVLTGKLYDAMLLKKNVLAIVNGQKADSEMKERIEGCRLGFCCEEAVKEDFNKMKQWIKSQYEEKINI
ncbi:hypothetical protein D7X25_31795, partial [bacterium 1XD42-8]